MEKVINNKKNVLGLLGLLQWKSRYLKTFLRLGCHMGDANTIISADSVLAVCVEQ